MPADECQRAARDAPILHRRMRHSPMRLTTDCGANADDALQDALEGLVKQAAEQPSLGRGGRG